VLTLSAMVPGHDRGKSRENHAFVCAESLILETLSGPYGAGVRPMNGCTGNPRL